MNKLHKKILFLLLWMVYCIPGILYSQTEGSLYINKHYFTSGETVWFAFYSNKNTDTNTDIPLIINLLQIRKNDQYLKEAVKINLRDHISTGYLNLPDNLESGIYYLGAFPQTRSERHIPWSLCEIFVYNPRKAFSSNELASIHPALYSPVNENSNVKSAAHANVKLNISPVSLQAGKNLTVNGQVIDQSGQPAKANVSVTVVDRRFYQPKMNLKILKDAEKLSFSDLESDQKYIKGKLLINDNPGEIQKVYFYAYKDQKILLDKYITDYEGNFRFLIPDYENDYRLEILTYPQVNKTYQFKLTNLPYFDSLYQINTTMVMPEHIDQFTDLALKQFLVQNSYAAIGAMQSMDTSAARISTFARPSHSIKLQDYVHFSTLPEIIREIVPQVTVKYTHDKYEVRIWDTRAKNYCCNEDPLIFVNTEPFLDINPVMKLNTNDIAGIDVIRPIEAIKAFGDIGVNGIMAINLKDNIKENLIASRGKAYFKILGEETKREYQSPEFGQNDPDFRSFLYWNGELDTNATGTFSFEFKNSLLPSEYIIVINGITESGIPVSSTFTYNTFEKETN